MAARQTFRRNCPECGQQFETTTHDRLFCTPAHKTAFHNRSTVVGRVAIPLAMAWREARNAKGNSPEARALRASGARAFADFCRLIDAAVTDDRENGRMKKLDYVRRRSAVQGTLKPEEKATFHLKADEAKKKAAEAAKKAAIPAA